MTKHMHLSFFAYNVIVYPTHDQDACSHCSHSKLAAAGKWDFTGP